MDTLGQPKRNPDLVTDTQAQEIAQQSYKNLGTQYGVAKIPLATYNGVDTPHLPFTIPIPSTGTGVLSQSQLTGVINGGSSIKQTVYSTNTGTPILSNILTLPIPVIQGLGTTQSISMTGAAAAGATSATLTAPWGGTTSTIYSQFDDHEIRQIKYTSGSTAITWVGGLESNTVTAGITVQANARFHGGDAPLGTQIVFVNTDDGLYQLWIRADLVGGTPDLINKWIGINADVLSP